MLEIMSALYCIFLHWMCILLCKIAAGIIEVYLVDLEILRETCYFRWYQSLNISIFGILIAKET